MKTLYISDLDGTLLTSDARLSPYAENSLSRMLAEGLPFTFATARTGESALKIMGGLPLTLPCILMNGVLIYDPKQGGYIHEERFTPEAVEAVTSLLKEHGAGGFLYRLSGGTFMTYYERVDSPEKQQFIEERQKRYNKPFTQVEDFCSLGAEDVIYFCLLEPKEKLEPVAAALRLRPDVGFAFYKDVYHAGMWYLEIFSSKASKYHAAVWLKEYLGAEELVGFGDNLNDLPLFEACSRRYAVENAEKELKQRADGVIGSSTGDGVIHFLEREWEQAVPGRGPKRV